MPRNARPTTANYLLQQAEDPEGVRDARDEVIDQELEDRLAQDDATPELEGTRHPGTGQWIPFTPRRPGFSGTSKDWERLYVVLEEQKRRQHPSWDEQDVKAAALAKYEKLKVHRGLPALPGEYVELEQSSFAPPREGLRQNIEAAAIRRLPQWQEMEALLTGCKPGRNSERRLPLAVFLKSVLGKGMPELRNDIEEFVGSNLELDWAYLGSHDMAENLTHMRDESTVRRVLKRMLERNDPDECVRLNLEVMQEMQERHPDLGRYLVVDATPIQAFVEQTVPLNDEHEALIVRDTGAKLHFHGDASGGDDSDGDSDGAEGGGRAGNASASTGGGQDKVTGRSGRRRASRSTGQRRRKGKAWVGWSLVVISDMKTGLPLIWKLVADGPEYPHVIPMLTEMYRLAPWMPVGSYLVGDSEYDRSTRLAFDLQARFSICGVFPLRKGVGRFWEHSKTDGVPYCAEKGHDAMSLVQAPEDFGLDKVPLGYEPDFAKARKDFPGRTRWYCEKCQSRGIKLTANTWFRRNPRLYPMLPHRGNSRYRARRVALMLRRNSIEQVFSQLKRRGIGNKHHQNCRWVTKSAHIEWLCSAALFGMTARRHAHETGQYAAAAAEAWDLKLTKLQPALQSTRKRAA